MEAKYYNSSHTPCKILNASIIHFLNAIYVCRKFERQKIKRDSSSLHTSRMTTIKSPYIQPSSKGEEKGKR